MAGEGTFFCMSRGIAKHFVLLLLHSHKNLRGYLVLRGDWLVAGQSKNLMLN